MRSNTLREQAAEWVIVLDDEDCPAEKRAEFDAWLSAAPAHRDAFERARRIWRDLDAVALPGEDLEYLAAPSVRAGAARRPQAARYGMWAGVACAVMAVASVMFQNDLQRLLLADARTAYGETRELTLADGTHVRLDTHSAIAFRMTPERREATVLGGEAVFDIAGGARPFHVRAGEADITDIGTVFQVRLERDGGVAVTVSEGEVNVEQAGASARVLHGQRLSVSRHGAPAPAEAADIDAATAWQRGRLVFVDQPLGRVVAELNRYTPGHIQLANGALADLRVSGVYRTDDPFAALSAIEASLGVRVLRAGAYALVMPRGAAR